MLSRAQREDEAEITGVARNQPHMRDLPTFKYEQTDTGYFVSELGRFCRLYHDFSAHNPPAYRESTAFLRYSAGKKFAEAIDNDLVAQGLKPRERGDAETARESTDEELAALAACPMKCPECWREGLCRQDRREKCAKLLAAAKGSIVDVDRRAVSACTKLCHEGVMIPDSWHGLAKNGLYRLSLHFGIEKPGYHDGQRK
jgi:hypothetical protein